MHHLFVYVSVSNELWIGCADCSYHKDLQANFPRADTITMFQTKHRLDATEAKND